MSKPEPDAEKEALVHGYVEGTLTPPESARLQALLREDPLLARVIMENLQMDGAIREITAETVPAIAATPKASDSQKIRSTRRFRSVPGGDGDPNWTPLVVAAVAAAVLIGMLFIFLPSTSDPAPRPVSKRIEDNRRKLREAEAARQAAQRRLDEIQKKSEALAQPKTTPVADPAVEQRERQTLASERQKVEEELREAIRKFNEAKEEIDRPEPETTVVKEPTEPSSGSTVPAGATILPEGEVFLVKGQEKTLLQGARAFTSGEELETGVGSAQARIVFPDRSLVLVGPDTRIGQIRGGAHKLVSIVRGTIRAQVTKQGAGSMAFSSPYGDAKVFGTSLRIVVDPTGPGSMRLEVTEGKVQLQRLLDKKTVEVTTGHYAVSAAGAEMVALKMLIDDIALYPSMGSVSGSEWQSVEDPQATSGYALEAVQTSPRIKSAGSTLVNKTRPDHVSFTFQADSYRDYAVRIKGSNLGSVAVSIPGASIRPALAGTGAYPLPNFAATSGYVWVGGEGNAAALAIRFTGAGSRTLNLYAAEAPVRVDSIWLSAIKTTAEAHFEKTGEVTVLFGPETRPMPNDVEYLLDSAKEFDVNRGYGWVGPLPWTDINMTKPKTDLGMSFVAGGNKTVSHSWVFLIPNGKYYVTAQCGIYNAFAQGPHMVRVQEKPIVNLAMTDVGGFYKSPEVLVEVKDGRLVMSIGGHQSNIKPPDKSDDTVLNYLKIRRAK